MQFNLPTLNILEAYSRWSSARIDRKICTDGAYWLFILGVNNSGTTILANILEKHPEIRTLPAEGQWLTTAFPRPDLVGVERLWSRRMDIFRWSEGYDPVPALQAKKDWAGLYSKNKGILLEKSPPNTVRSLWLQKNFAPSRFLSIIRSPYAVCEGIRRRTNYTIREAAQHWIVANTCLLGDLRHIKKNLLVKYEDLVDEPHHTLMEIESFLGLKKSFDIAACGGVAAHSFEGNTVGLRNLNDESFNRLSRDEIQEINTLCGDMMQRFGYPLKEK